MPINVHRLQLQFDAGANPGNAEQQAKAAIEQINSLLQTSLSALNAQFIVYDDEIEVDADEEEDEEEVEKLTLTELLEDQDLSTFAVNTNCLEDMICPWCLYREQFKIHMVSPIALLDAGTEEHTDTEWDLNSHCQCGNCNRHGKVKDFEFKGLDDLLKKHQAK